MKGVLGTTLSELLSDQAMENIREDDHENALYQIAEEWFKEGVDFLKNDQFIKAAIKMGAVSIVKPDHVKAQNNLAVALANLGETEEALNVIEKILEKDPSNATALKNRKAIEEQMEEN